MLVMASNVKDAYEKIASKMGTSMAEYSITAISISTILDVFEYDPNIKLPSNLKPLSEVTELEKIENQ